MKIKQIILGLSIVMLSGVSVFSQSNKKSIQDKKMEAIVMPFYQGALTVNTKTNPADALNSVLADDFISFGTSEKANKSKEQLIGQLNFFWKMIPDLVWEPQEVIVNGNQVIVRSKVTGTPNSPEGKFMGVPTNGSKSFHTMSIDIHTIENGKIVKVRHVEDWISAIKQVSSK